MNMTFQARSGYFTEILLHKLARTHPHAHTVDQVLHSDTSLSPW